MIRSLTLVAMREASERVRSRAYQVGTVAMLVIVAGAFVVIALADDGPPTYDIGVVGEPPIGFDPALAAAATNAGALTDIVPFASEEEARAAVADGTIDAAVVGGDLIIVEQAGGSNVEQITETALRQAFILDRLTELGIDPEALSGSIRIDSTSAPESDGDEAVAVIAVMLLFVVITTYGQWVLLGVLEEKTTGVIEQVVSSISVRALLGGKLLGIGVLGMAQLVLIVIAAIVAGAGLELFDLPDASLPVALWALVWFVIGFGIYAALYAAAGSLVSRTEDAQAVAMPVALVGVAGYLMAFIVVIPNPDSAGATALSLVPLVAPFAYPARIAASAVPGWELALGVALSVVAVYLIVRLAARVYAGALLAGGKVKLRQAWRAAGELVGPGPTTP